MLYAIISIRVSNIFTIITANALSIWLKSLLGDRTTITIKTSGGRVVAIEHCIRVKSLDNFVLWMERKLDPNKVKMVHSNVIKDRAYFEMLRP